ncbi:MAG TPA: hypothetical protein DDX89_04945 [Candidatus Omnitrophica bacterium]|nr:MAG: hypothetical protein A2105_02910 [Omnitrophica WOR_2 bacterium GWF2_63_9]OGX31230.1 MAG: hypothetical protein A3E56_03060 [Omnitrophica WOR_2 bacterium RIFCSPHIGHO2_12_FULL_64_13]OGX36466.1 MAG: hypothetical protein A3B73_01145 [Omnitrophica WOR_2 bacterium RIFCSPHIGHO2_02_FULL_63_39]OGX44831.1 MAG: hypothetical protein A3I71_04190 [Omnitrophica WOR_2 bacterium RIFCSPLOWO2_02_FULL_63_16]OGX48062.1 MAG: hypothetical protein A3G88_01850 [Omnitrophica WOR_2 bacterium RIFCSPLOWO2_12_FULL_63
MIARAFFRYTLTVAIAAVSALAGATIVNGLVDPYGMYRLADLPGLTAQKPAIYHRVRLLKAYEVRRLKPHSLLLGSSRSHLAFRTSHEGWARQASRRYNLAFDGATTKEMYAYLIHAHAVSPLTQVLLALDTYHPTTAPAATRPDFDPALLLTQHRAVSWWRRLTADLKLLTSFDTLRDSVKTLTSQQAGDPEWYAPDGQRLGEVFFRRSSENFVKVGPRAYFEEIDQLEVGFKLEWRIPVSPGTRVSTATAAKSDASTSLDDIRRLVAFCRTHRIDLRIFLTPAHAHQLELDAATGGWPALEHGKRALVDLLAQDAARHPDQPPIPLWDFSGYSTITTEPLPPPTGHAEMQWYWDSSHFKEQVGDLVLDRVLDFHESGRVMPADFGIRLTPETIESTLAQIRTAQAAYRQQHPDDLAAIRAWVADYKRRHRISDE